jgi:CHAT domain-containing protein
MYFSEDKTQKSTSEFLNDISIFMNPVFGEVPTNETDASNQQSLLESFTQLPWTEHSQKNIKYQFGDKKITVLSGNAATIQALLSEGVRRSKLLHIATHAYTNLAHPELSGLVTTSTKSLLGYISLDELLARPFYSDLVVLSACETQMGSYYETEGTRGLAYSFLAQGADSVIGTLWKVDDKSTAIFMRLFYQALNANNGHKAKALQTAKNQMKRLGRYKSEVYWAGFVLTNTHNTTEIINL